MRRKVRQMKFKQQQRQNIIKVATTFPVAELLPLPKMKRDETGEQNRWRRLGFPVRLRRAG